MFSNVLFIKMLMNKKYSEFTNSALKLKLCIKIMYIQCN